jgi:hypothetical protein
MSIKNAQNMEYSDIPNPFGTEGVTIPQSISTMDF